MKHQHKEGCAVCGARPRFYGETCDAVCGRAKNSGRTRAGQLIAEMRTDTRADRARALADRFHNHVAVRVIPDDRLLNYAA